jgi:8-oxo-dGTP diphosphatase
MNALQLAGCVILDEAGRVLLLHRFADEYEQWEIPGGKLKKGEAAEAAAVREVREELGIEVTIMRRLGEGVFSEKGRQMNYAWYLAATKPEPSIQEPDTFDRLNYFAIDDLNILPLSAGAGCFVSLLDKRTITL